MGGETSWIISRVRMIGGPSPRGRGNHQADLASRPRVGSIPAWAGKPASRGPGDIARMGPSPRGRGNPRETSAEIGPRLAVHPRVGGETSDRRSHLCAQSDGPSPRGRGNPSHVEQSAAGSAWAGNPSDVPISRSIPAWAGKPLRRRGGQSVWVHPRVGGETTGNGVVVARRRRVHPRVGGETRKPHDRRSIPAWAGKPAAAPDRRIFGSIPAWAGKSPRGRGNHPRVGGETVLEMRTARMGVHPRVGGETSV